MQLLVDEQTDESIDACKVGERDAITQVLVLGRCMTAEGLQLSNTRFMSYSQEVCDRVEGMEGIRPQNHPRASGSSPWQRM